MATVVYEKLNEFFGENPKDVRAIIDKVVDEPVGGAHRDSRAMAATLKRALSDALRELEVLTPSDLVAQRYEKLMSYGRYKEKAA